MREIEFRGKTLGNRVDKSYWVYGGIAYAGGEAYIIKWNENDGETNDEVYETTVGQYTGLKDKNGVKIFEGDIISLITVDGERIVITCEFGNACRKIFDYEVEITGFYFIRSDNGRKCYPLTHNYLGKHDTEIWEVIGNIHDNPELLCVKKDKELK